MKKYLLTALLWLFGLVSFASAEIITFNYSESDWAYNPSYYNNSSEVQLSLSYWDCVASDPEMGASCGFSFIDNQNNHIWDIYYEEWRFYYNDTWIYNSEDIVFTLPAWDYGIESPQGFWYSTITFNVSSVSGGDDWTWWDSWNWTWDILLPWWEWSLSWIITWLNSTITEFIPYLVYLWLWIITVVIWFVAIRWLVNRTQAKIRWSFSSWRRRK